MGPGTSRRTGIPASVYEPASAQARGRSRPSETSHHRTGCGLPASGRVKARVARSPLCVVLTYLTDSWNQASGNFEIGRVLHLKAEIRDFELDRPEVQF